MTNWIIETPVDFNNDGIFTTDLLQEGHLSCVVGGGNLILDFTMLNKSENIIESPINETPITRVQMNENGDLIQSLGCLTADGFFTRVEFNENMINFMNVLFPESPFFSGELIDNNSFLVIVFMNNFFIKDSIEILNEDGTIEGYEGDTTLIYRRIQ